LCPLQSATASREVRSGQAARLPRPLPPSRRDGRSLYGFGEAQSSQTLLLFESHCILALPLSHSLKRHLLAFTTYRYSSIRGKECHICGQHAAMPQHECQTFTSRGTCPASGKATRIRIIMSTLEPAPPTRTLSIFSASLLNVLSIEDGTSHEGFNSPSALML
jgi:hypothetical protein